MQGNRQRSIVVTVVAAVLLVPVIIWSGMQQSAAGTHRGVSKTLPVMTVGPEMTPYVMTPLEREKLALPAWSSPVPMDVMSIDVPKATIGSKGPYPGMTPAELDKLARWKEPARHTYPVTPEEKEPVSTIEAVPRARGIEGLTPLERAKLEAYLKSRSR